MAAAANILLVEDEEDIQQLVAYNLMKAGYRVLCAESGEAALALLALHAVALVLLDRMLPGMDGLAICKAMRADPAQGSVPIVMLTAKGEEEDILAGLHAGADDYVTKPFSPKVLLARVQSVLRRSAGNKEATTPAAGAPLRLHNLLIDAERHELLVEERPVATTVTEFAILLLLAKTPGRVYTRQQIIDQIRGYEFMVGERNIDVQVFGLRKKLGPAGSLIETVRGIGYRFKER